MRVRPFAVAFLLALTVGAMPAVRAADDPEIALQRQLDQPLTLTLQSVTLTEAFRQIATASKVPVQVDPTCYELLPYGDTTRVSIDFKQSKLRDALDEVLIPLALQKTISATGIMIRPSGPLKRIGRKAEWEELKLLKELYSSDDLKIPPAAAGTAAAPKFSMAESIRAAMEGRKDLVVIIPGESNGALSPAQERALEQIAKQLPMTAYRALETYCQLTGSYWCVETSDLAGGAKGGKVMVMSPRQWIARQLERPIKISRQKQPLEVVVADLSRASGIRFVPSPGLYLAVPEINLLADDATVLQTLETLAGGTGVAFEVRDDSVLLYHVERGAGAPARADTVVGRISIPWGDAGSMELYVRESDLTPEQRELVQKRLQQFRDNLRIVPPATAPANGAAAAPAKE